MKKPQLKELSLREKIGQTAAVKQSLLDSVGDINIFFKENPYGSMWVQGAAKLDFINMADSVKDHVEEDLEDKLCKFFDDINSYMKIPIMPALDAENGAARTFPSFNHTTYPTGLGAARNQEFAYQVGKSVAKEVKLAGCRWIWGPVVDNASPLSSINLTRTYSDDVKLNCELVKAHIQGIQSENVAATVKHFPGADRDEYRDSHISNSAIHQNYEEWFIRQGAIFQEAINAGVNSVMIGHVSFEAVDNTKISGTVIPATLSKTIITDLLKGKMHFDGVVITDAIGMKGLSRLYDVHKLYIELLKAGNDVILGPAGADYIDFVEQAVKNGELSEERIDDACRRVLDMKEKLGLFDDCKTQYTKAEKNEVLIQSRKINENIAPYTISWVCNQNNLIPVDRNKIKNVSLIYTGYSDEVYKKLDIVKNEFEKYNAEVFITDEIDSDSIREIAKKSDLIIYFLHIAPHAPLGMGSFYNDKFRQFLYIMTEGEEKSIAVSTGSPYVYHDWLPNANSFINTYGIDEGTLRVLVRGIYGDCEFKGTHPFKLNPLAPRI